MLHAVGAPSAVTVHSVQLRAIRAGELWRAQLHYARLEREARLGLAAVWMRNRLFGVSVFLGFATFGGASPAYLVLQWPGVVAALAALIWAALMLWGLRDAGAMHRLAARLAAEETHSREAVALLRARAVELRRAWDGKTMHRHAAHRWTITLVVP